jgi:hypothetical protein
MDAELTTRLQASTEIDTSAVMPETAQSMSEQFSTNMSGDTIPTVIVSAASDRPIAGAKATNSAKDSAIDNIAVVLDLVKDLGDFVEKFPFIKPIATVLSTFVKTYNVCLNLEGQWGRTIHLPPGMQGHERQARRPSCPYHGYYPRSPWHHLADGGNKPCRPPYAPQARH